MAVRLIPEEGNVSSMATNAGQPYEDAEIALVYLVEGSKEADELLALLLGRTPGAINMMRRWAEGADFPPEAYNRIRRQFEWAEKKLGAMNKGKIRVSR
jgi:hypothetical protein